MSWIRRLWNVVGGDVDRDIDEELQFHIDQRIGDNIALGMNPEEARLDAVRRFGNRAAASEQTRDADVLVTTDYRSVLSEVVTRRFGVSTAQVFPGFAPTPVGVMA